MKKLLLSFFCCLMAFVSVQAENYEFTFEKKEFTENETKELDGISWTLDGEGGKPSVYNSEKGQQFGKAAEPYTLLTLSTSDFNGTIKKIRLTTLGAKDTDCTVTVTVGGTQLGETFALTNDVTEYEFKGAAIGEVKITYTQTSKKAIYIKKIAVTYGDASEPEKETVATPIISPESCEFNDGENIEVTISAEEGSTIYYTLDGNDPTKESNVYSTPFNVTKTTTVKAFAVKENCDNSSIAKAIYTKVITFEGSVTKALAIYDETAKINATITGYIVGVVTSQYGIKSEEDVLFSNDTAKVVASNILIADNADETDYTKCIPVQLSSGTPARKALNLKENYDKYKTEVVLSGTLEKYFSVAGLKNTKIVENNNEEDDNEENSGNEGNEDGENSGDENETATPTTTDQLIEGKNQEITGWIIAINTVSFIVEDGEGCVLVYLGTVPQYKEGQVVKVQGVVEKYFEMLQFPRTSIVTPTNETREIKRPEPMVMDAAAMDAYLNSPYIEYVEYTGTISVSGAYYNVAINGAATAIGSITYPSQDMMKNISGTVKVTGYTTGISQGKYINTMAVKVENITDGTGIKNVELENYDAVIFDITGRRVSGITVPGIYIVNGKKILVK